MIPPTLMMTNMIIKTGVISVLTLVTKQIYPGRLTGLSKRAVTHILHRSMFHRKVHEEAVR
jgi:hypothetical protein